MSNIINLAQKKKEIKEKQDLKNKTALDGQTVRLWRLSMAIDDLIKQGVLDDSLPPDEIAAILAHRLGTLISCTERSEELAQFCCHIIQRMNSKQKMGEPA